MEITDWAYTVIFSRRRIDTSKSHIRVYGKDTGELKVSLLLYAQIDCSLPIIVALVAIRGLVSCG